MKKLNLVLMYLVFATLGLNLVLPFFDKHENFLVSADPIDEPFIYIIGEIPGGTIILGNNVHKELNVQYFKDLFNSHTNINLQYRLNNSAVWLNGNQYLDITKTWNDALLGWKINFTMNKPETSDVIDARFIFSCDLPVLNYMEREDKYTWFINYTIPDFPNETYRIYFNWSDLLQYNNLIINKGIQDNNFYFIIQRNEITKNAIVINLDPNMGFDTTDADNNVFCLADNFRGVSGYSTGSYQVDSIFIYLSSGTWTSGEAITCGIYDSGLNLLTNGVTPESTSGGDGWVEFSFSTKPSVSTGIYLFGAMVDSIVTFSSSNTAEDVDGNGGVYYEGMTYASGMEDPIGGGWDSTDTTKSLLCYAVLQTIDSTPPTPNPETFSVNPDGLGDTSIDMTATTGSDVSTPISCQFVYVSSPTGGTGGTSSGWQVSDYTYSDAGLQENHQYGYYSQLRDSVPNTGTQSSTVYAYTNVNYPSDAEITIDSFGDDWIKVYVDECGNPSDAECYIDCTSGGATDSGWISTREYSHFYHNFTGLSKSSEYCFKAQYRNGDDDASGFNAVARCQTTSSGASWNLIATYTADFGNDTLSASLVATHTADFGNDTLESNLIATHSADFGNDTLESNLIATHSADFGNDSLSANLIDTHTADFGNDTPTIIWNLIATHTADFGNDTGWYLIATHSADFGNDSLSANLIDTHTADFGNDTPTIIWNLIATHTADFGNDTGWYLIATHSADFGNDTGNFTITDIYNIVNWINTTLFEGDGIMNIGLTGSLLGICITLILFILFFVIGYRENKRSGGAFMLLSGFMLISLEIITASYLDSLYLLPLLTPVSIFIMILGIRKWLYPVENEYTKSEGT